MTLPIRPSYGLPPVVSPLERGLQGLDGLPGTGAVEGPSFADLLKKGLNEVQGTQDVSDDLIRRSLRGEQVELHQLMAASAEAGISLSLLVEMRNKLTDAYRQVMNTQL